MSMNNKNNNSWKDIIGEFSANSNVGLYLKGLEHLNTEENQKLYEEKYLPVIQGEKKENSPFLSVIIRTQGKREQGLRRSPRITVPTCPCNAFFACSLISFVLLFFLFIILLCSETAGRDSDASRPDILQHHFAVFTFCSIKPCQLFPI